MREREEEREAQINGGGGGSRRNRGRETWEGRGGNRGEMAKQANRIRMGE